MRKPLAPLCIFKTGPCFEESVEKNCQYLYSSETWLVVISCVVANGLSQYQSALQWRHNGRDSVSNHRPHDCLFKRLFRRWSEKTLNSASLYFVRGIHRWPVNSPHKRPVRRKMFPFDDVIMRRRIVRYHKASKLCDFWLELLYNLTNVSAVGSTAAETPVQYPNLAAFRLLMVTLIYAIWW